MNQLNTTDGQGFRWHASLVTSPSTLPIRSGCTTICDYSFNVTTSGTAKNFQDVASPNVCSGHVSQKPKVPRQCIPSAVNHQIFAYITEDNVLKIEYVDTEPKKDAQYTYYGSKAAKAATSGKGSK